MAQLFQSILNKAKKGNKAEEQRPLDWLRAQALKVNRANPKNIMDNTEPFKRIQQLSINSIGKMYMFNYDAKHKATLPYFDQYPLIFPVEFYGDSFLGINLHYLPPIYRAKLMDALYTVINNEKYNKTTKLKISYNILKGATKFKYFEPCLKKYLFSQVKSTFMYVAPDEWDVAMMLPFDRFVGAKRQTVYRDSLAKVR